MSKEWPLWEIFIRSQHGLAHKHVGSLHAPDAEMAVNNARDVYTRRNEGVSRSGWCKACDIVASSPGDKAALVRAVQQQGLSAPDLLPDAGRSEEPVSSGHAETTMTDHKFEYLLRLGRQRADPGASSCRNGAARGRRWKKTWR